MLALSFVLEAKGEQALFVLGAPPRLPCSRGRRQQGSTPHLLAGEGAAAAVVGGLIQVLEAWEREEGRGGRRER